MKKTICYTCISILLLSVSCIVERDIDLGYGYRLVSNGVDDKGIIDENNIYIIYGHVLSYKIDSFYLLVAERPRDSVPEAKGLPLKAKDEKFYSSDFVQYWIVENCTKEKLGPVKLEKFKVLCDSLGVSPNAINSLISARN